jgi:hypothetical protein
LIKKTPFLIQDVLQIRCLFINISLLSQSGCLKISPIQMACVL